MTTTMLSSKHVTEIKASAPVLAEKGEAITTRFYEQMFEAHPELLNIFNHRNQKQGTQPRALMQTLYAAAVNIENLEALLPTVQKIAHKHVALQIVPEQYPIVGHYLIKAMKEELGDAASDELLEAWGQAYEIVADIFIEAEKKLYQETKNQRGGWNGFRPFVVDAITKESDGITSFYFKPEDGNALPTFSPGQYITLRVLLPDDPYTHLRHYSLSDAPGKDHFRISVKRETAPGYPDGAISNFLHDHLDVGDQIPISAPAGVFTVDTNADHPLVLLGAGVGQTPLISMAKGALDANPDRKIDFVYTAKNEDNHALLKEMNVLNDQYDNFQAHVRYTDTDDHINRELLQAVTKNDAAEFFLCGPGSFTADMKEILENDLNISESNIQREMFKPFV
ncbi:NO-inducible flavohemoprotein [Salicibibacter cibarius]|uniref:Flavohemoprotein n=1 Tax=Salicibibacter cibarius TaxID=2743000 RepID=A0A7T6Z263_9BACI|nr:NO-inducible flavohemoprotein [Salicibibacter cibarius]QQK75336.1 NO-inducible flavohemoprotein [Salicibibacter cibarius]